MSPFEHTPFPYVPISQYLWLPPPPPLVASFLNGPKGKALFVESRNNKCEHSHDLILQFSFAMKLLFTLEAARPLPLQLQSTPEDENKRKLQCMYIFNPISVP